MTPAFDVGERVRVDDRDQAGHVRTPYYIRGKSGTIESVRGTAPNPELLAKGELGLPYRRLYRVTFEQAAVWPDYTGGSRDRVVVDIYEHWLSRA
jgi:hypothetical protein